MHTSRFPGKQGVPSRTWSASFLEKYKPNSPFGVQCNSQGETKKKYDRYNETLTKHILICLDRTLREESEIEGICRRGGVYTNMTKC